MCFNQTNQQITQITASVQYQIIFATRIQTNASVMVYTQLIDYEQIMIVLTEYTQAGKLVSTMGIDPEASSDAYNTYALKDTYKEQIETKVIACRCTESTHSKCSFFSSVHVCIYMV